MANKMAGPDAVALLAGAGRKVSNYRSAARLPGRCTQGVFMRSQEGRGWIPAPFQKELKSFGNCSLGLPRPGEGLGSCLERAGREDSAEGSEKCPEKWQVRVGSTLPEAHVGWQPGLP